MTEAQIQLQNALTTTFLANLAFLSEYDNKLYHRVDELSRMIENRTYKEKYALEFILENGDFDIYDIINDKYLYNKNPKKTNNDLIRKVQFDEKSSILDIAQHFAFKHQSKIDRTDKFNFEYLAQFNTLTLNDTWEYANILDDFVEVKNKSLKKIEKFIFIGTLLGRHIPKIAEKVNAEMYLVLERNLEIFRLSLFVVDYTILGRKGAIFSIMDSPRDEEKKIFDFLKINKLNNYILKFSTTTINIDEYVDNILSILHTLNPIGYDYNRKLYAYINRTTKVINSNFKTLLFNKVKENCKFFEDVPILYLAAGPSLDENIEWIKKNQNKFFIVCIGRIFQKLFENEIRVDLITTLDEQKAPIVKQFNEKIINKIDKDTLVFASSITNEEILKSFNQKNLFIYEIFNSFHKDNIVFDGFSVGEITLAILLQMNPSEIYLLGLDLALNQETGASHSQQSNSLISALNLKEEQNRKTFSDRKSLIRVKGNFEKEVFTTPLFYTSIKSTESKILRRNKTIKIYNLSSHGAYFFDTIPTNINDIKTNEFKELKFTNNEFRKFLFKNSTKKLSKKSQKRFEEEIFIIENNIKDLLSEVKEKNFDKYENFLEKIITLTSVIYDFKLFILYQVIVNYYEIVIPYLSYHFNSNKIRNEHIEVENIKKIFLKQTEDILNDYVICVKRLVN